MLDTADTQKGTSGMLLRLRPCSLRSPLSSLVLSRLKLIRNNRLNVMVHQLRASIVRSQDVVANSEIMQDLANYASESARMAASRSLSTRRMLRTEDGPCSKITTIMVKLSTYIYLSLTKN